MSAAYDRGKLVELFGHDPKTMAEVEQQFLDTARDAAREIAATDDAAVIARAAHRLKGASGMIGAGPLRDIAAIVEQAARSADLASVRRLQATFDHEVARVAEQVHLART
jgi:HPt (histidine-containing phosphotransfer) domain-containing protein